MSRALLSVFSSLLVVAVSIPAGAQAPPGTVVSDSATADSVKPKKGRFGGMMDKAKKVAGSKTVQGAVKGAAANVACNAVPGAAVAAAATGNATCQNTVMGGLVQKGMAGAAGVAASGVAAKAAGKLGGTTGAAAAGALSGATGANIGAAGLKSAAAGMAGAKVAGLGQAATAAAAGKILKGATGQATNAASMAAAQSAAAQMMQGGALPKGATMPSANDMAAAVAAMNAMNTAAAGGKKVETIDFRELKAMLPASLGSLKRSEASGEKTGAMGMQISMAEGRYSSDDGKQITLKITDIGALAGIGAMSAYAWAQTEVDRESDSGYEKSTTFKGYKALEKYSKQGQQGDLSVLVGGRFVVEADGSSVDMKAIKAALETIDLKKLDGMKGKGVH